MAFYVVSRSALCSNVLSSTMKFCRTFLKCNEARNIFSGPKTVCMLDKTSDVIQTRFCLLHLANENNMLERISCDVKKVETIWKKNKSKEDIKQFLNECFEADNTLSYPLNFAIVACDRLNHQLLDLTFEIMSLCNEWLDTKSHFWMPTLEQKTEALRVAVNQKNFHLLQLVCTVFKINNDMDNFKGFIEMLLQQQKITEASYCICALNLQSNYPINEVILPLICDGKMNIALIYMTNQPDVQLEVAKTLDSMLHDVSKTKQRNASYVLHPRKAFKVLNMIINTFKIDPVECPNLHHIRRKTAINLLIRRRAEQSILEDSWKEMILSIVGDNEELKLHLLNRLIYKDDVKTAIHLVKELDIQEDHLPAALTSESDVSFNETNNECETLEEICEECDGIEEMNTTEHLTFELDSSAIKFVGTKKEFINCIHDLKQNYNMIGIDSEWKPQFGLYPSRLSLIQLAVNDKVYILDMLSLNDCFDTKDWDMLMDDIFGNPKIIKLGCGLMTDVEMIVESYQGTKGRPIRFSHILDMAILYKKLKEVYPEEMDSPIDRNSSHKGLSKLCHVVLGKPLNKEERLCDWEKRPLKDSQLEYAALDGLCLLQIYDKLKKYATEKNMNFNHIAKVSIVLTNSQWKPKRRLNKVKHGNSFNVKSPLHIKYFKVIVDSKLQAVGRLLRQFGADVIILQSSDTAADAIQQAKSEGRIILCGEQLWNEVKGKLPDWLCFNASINAQEEEITVPQILQYFNVQVTASNIYSRCLTCNGENCIKLSPEDFEIVKQLSLQSDEGIDQTNSQTHKIFSVVESMRKTGISVKFDTIDDVDTKNQNAFLCTNCGNIQWHS